MNLWVHLVAVVFAVGVITTFDAKEVKEVECKDILRCKGPRKQKSKCKEDWAKIACKKTCGLCTSEQQTTTTTPPPPPTTAPPISGKYFDINVTRGDNGKFGFINRGVVIVELNVYNGEIQGDLQVGDTIIEIDQKSVTGVITDGHTDIDRLLQNSGASVTLRVMREAACLGIYSIDNYPCAQFTQSSTCKDRMPDCAWYIAGCNDSFPEPYRSGHPNYNCAKIAKRGWCDFTWKYIFTQMLGKNDRKINEDCKKSCSNCGVPCTTSTDCGDGESCDLYGRCVSDYLELATQACNEFGSGWAVAKKTSGSVVCTKNGGAAGNYCDSCDSWRLLVWKDGAHDGWGLKPYSTIAGNFYSGHSPCENDDNYQWCGIWSKA